MRIALNIAIAEDAPSQTVIALCGCGSLKAGTQKVTQNMAGDFFGRNGDCNRNLSLNGIAAFKGSFTQGQES